MIPTVVEKPRACARCVVRQPAQLLLEHLETFSRHLVRHDVVDADLQVVEPGTIELLDAIATEEIRIGNERGDQAVRARREYPRRGIQQSVTDAGVA